MIVPVLRYAACTTDVRSITLRHAVGWTLAWLSVLWLGMLAGPLLMLTYALRRTSRRRHW